MVTKKQIKNLSFAIFIIFLVTFVALYIHYTFLGWKNFSFSRDQTVSIDPDGKTTDKIRFRKVIFTVVKANSAKTTFKIDVTTRMNQMAIGHKKTGLTLPLALIKPLNAFSFVVAGHNDTTVKDPSLPEWTNATVTLSGIYKIL